MMNKQIAAEMKLSEVTVKVHRHNLMKKLGAKSLARPGQDGRRSRSRPARYQALIDDGQPRVSRRPGHRLEVTLAANGPPRPRSLGGRAGWHRYRAMEVHANIG